MYIHTYLREGRTVHAKPPRNLFPVFPADEYLLLAAGIGITPIFPMARELDRRGAAWTLNYSVRDAARLPFRSELEILGDRVTINSPDRAGRLDLEQLLAEPRPGVSVYSCGPTRFIDAVESAMRDWSHESLHLERFEPKPIAARLNEPFTVHAARSNIDIEVPAEWTMLQALDAAGVAVAPSSCLRGVYGSCALRVLGGTPEHRDSLTINLDSTTIYPCVSRSMSDSLIVDL
jgi:ferredoxin-NADP reductase